jgi:hypothetical protein
MVTDGSPIVSLCRTFSVAVAAGAPREAAGR